MRTPRHRLLLGSVRSSSSAFSGFPAVRKCLTRRRRLTARGAAGRLPAASRRRPAGTKAVQAPPLQAPARDACARQPGRRRSPPRSATSRSSSSTTDAPVSVENFLQYANEGFYSDTIFHRVKPGFMIQGGGFTAVARARSRPGRRSRTRRPTACAIPAARWRWRAWRRCAARRRSSISTSSTTAGSITPATRPTSSGTPSSAACSPEWTSSITSPRSRPDSTASMDDVPVEPVIIKSVQVGRRRCRPHRARSRTTNPRCNSTLTCPAPLHHLSHHRSSTSSASGSSFRCCRSTPRRSARRRSSIGLLFASFSLSQLIAAPLLGDLSDRWGRRPVLIFSLLGTVVSFVMLALAHSLAMLFAARIVDGLSGGNITTARAYIADVSTEENRAKSFGLLGAAFGLGFIVGPALGAAFSRISYTAPIWAAAAITVVAMALAWFWLPETVHRTQAGGGRRGARSASLWRRPHLRVLFTIDFVYWTAFAVYQTTFALFGARRFGFDAAHIGYLLSAFGFLGVLVQGGMVGPVVRALGERRTLTIGLLFAAARLGRQRAHAFAAGVRRDARARRDRHRPVQRDPERADQQVRRPQEQGRVQGAAGALESLGPDASGRSGAMDRCSGSAKARAYGSAAFALLGAAALTVALPSAGPHAAVDAASQCGHSSRGHAERSALELALQPADQIVELLDHRHAPCPAARGRRPPSSTAPSDSRCRPI